jgi:hypothetical protein
MNNRQTYIASAGTPTAGESPSTEDIDQQYHERTRVLKEEIMELLRKIETGTRMKNNG